MGSNIDKHTLLRFGLPSIIAAFLGAFLLHYLSDLPPIFQFSFWGKTREITLVKLIIALLLMFFSLFELAPQLKNLEFNKKYLPFGGLLSGFFGGLSGHQGALRSAFLIRSGLSKERFIATGVAIACLIDVSRLSVYVQNISQISSEKIDIQLLVFATLSAFLGAYWGNKILKKITISSVQMVVAVALMIFSVFLALGMV